MDFTYLLVHRTPLSLIESSEFETVLVTHYWVVGGFKKDTETVVQGTLNLL